MTPNDAPNCLLCKRDDLATPLLQVRYRGETLWICPQHLPVLIHDPQSLVGILPGAAGLAPAEHRD